MKDQSESSEEINISGHTGHSGVMAVKDQLGDIDDEKIHRIKPNNSVYMEQMSEYKYDTVAAMIREYIQNGNATVIEAEEYLDGDFSPLIFVGYYPHDQRLVIMDNGMGWSREKIESVGTKPGTSTNIYNPKRPGAFGIGRLSAFKGVGSDGGFFMHTRSRRTGEYIKGIWTADAFVEQNELNDRLEDNQYGSMFIFPLKYVDVDVEKKVKEYSECLRNTVLYVKYGEDGSPEYKEEYGGKKFTEDADESKCLIYEDEYVRIVSGPSDKHTGNGTKNNKSVLMDVPCGLNNSVNTKNIPFRNVNYLIKQEQQFIVDGPNKGKIRVKDGEYNSLTQEQKDSGKYIKHSNTTEVDVPLLYPTGDRDRFHKNEKFMEWSMEQIVDVYLKKMSNVISDIVDADNIVQNVDSSDLEFFMSIMDGIRFRRDENTVIECIYGEMVDIIVDAKNRGIIDNDLIDKKDIHDEVVSEIKYLSRKIEICPQENGARITNRFGRKRVQHWELFDQIENGGTVYMCIRPVVKKAKAIWKDHEKNLLIKVKSTDQYEEYEERHGWKRLVDINNNTVDNLNIPDELKQRIKTNKQDYENENAGKDAPNRSITLHTLKTKRKNHTHIEKKKTVKLSAKEIKETIQCGDDIQYGIDKIVLFPSNSGKNLSDYYKWYPSNNIGIGTCAVKTYEYLRECENVYHIDDIIETANSQTVETVNGEMLAKDYIEQEGYNVIHVVNKDSFDEFSGSGLVHVEERVLKRLSSLNGFKKHDGEISYAMIEKDDLDNIPILFGDFVDVDVKYNEPHPLTLMINEGYMSKPNGCDRISPFDSDTELYVHSKIPEQKGTDVFKSLTDISSPLNKGGKDVVDTVAQTRYNK